MNSCNHVLINNPKITCGREKGHHGFHTLYEQVASRSITTEFKVHYWNDSGESPFDQEESLVAFQCDYDEGHDERQKIMNLAIFDAKKSLPKGTVFEVRSKLVPMNCTIEFGVERTRSEIAKKWGIAWYFVPKVIQPKGFEDYPDRATAVTPLFQNDVDKGQYKRDGGYILLARIKV